MFIFFKLGNLCGGVFSGIRVFQNYSGQFDVQGFGFDRVFKYFVMRVLNFRGCYDFVILVSIFLSLV